MRHDSPELVNSEPYAGGWIFKNQSFSDESEFESLLMPPRVPLEDLIRCAGWLMLIRPPPQRE